MFLWFAVFFAIITWLLAGKNGRNIFIAIVLWFLFNFLAFIIYLIAGKSQYLLRKERQEDRLEFLTMLEAVKK